MTTLHEKNGISRRNFMAVAGGMAGLVTRLQWGLKLAGQPMNRNESIYRDPK